MLEEIDDIENLRLDYDFETTEIMLRTMMAQALKTNRLLCFTLERILYSASVPHPTEPLFHVKYGHFGFKIFRLTHFFPKDWFGVGRDEKKGRLIEDSQFFCKWFRGLPWIVNHLSLTPIGSYQYKEIPTSPQPKKIKRLHTIPLSDIFTELLVIEPPFGETEVLPYYKNDNGHRIGRWVWLADQLQWKIEWFSIEEDYLADMSYSIVKKEDYHSPFFYREEDDVIRDFLHPLTPYFPPNYISCLTDDEKRQQLENAIWWMETRHRILPRYAKEKLKTLLAQTIRKNDVFHFPAATNIPALTTTKLLELYTRWGNPLLRFITTHS